MCIRDRLHDARRRRGLHGASVGRAVAAAADTAAAAASDRRRRELVRRRKRRRRPPRRPDRLQSSWHYHLPLCRRQPACIDFITRLLYEAICTDNNKHFGLQTIVLSARDVIYTSRAYATMSVSVCLWRKCIRSRCMSGTQRLHKPAKLKPSYDPQQTWPPPMEGSSRAMLATARPSCSLMWYILGEAWLTVRRRFDRNSLPRCWRLRLYPQCRRLEIRT